MPRGKFWEFHERLFASSDRFGQRAFERHAEQLGLDPQRFSFDFNSQAARDAVKADLQLGFELGVSGTPALFINGFFVDGVRSEATYETIIDRELEAAGALEAQGVARSDLHRRLMTDALERENYPNHGEKAPSSEGP